MNPNQKLPKFSDLGDLTEDDRIAVIGNHVMEKMQTVTFIVETKTKAARYISKLKEKFPGIVLVGTGKGPIAKTITVKMRPPVERN
jgi:hypothetical protein